MALGYINVNLQTGTRGLTTVDTVGGPIKQVPCFENFVAKTESDS